MSNCIRSGERLGFILLVSFCVLSRVTQAGLVCSTKQSGQLYQVGINFNCKEEKFRSVEIQLYKQNVREYRSKAYSLKVEEKVCETYLSFVGTKVAQRYTKAHTWVNPDRYKHHMQRQSCEDLEGRTFVGGVQRPDFQCSYSYLKHQKTVVLACVHEQGVVIGARNKMTRSDLGDVSHCKYQDGFCMTSEKRAIMWQPESEEKEEFLDAGKHNATMLNDNHLMIDKLGLAFDLREWSKQDNVYTKEEFKIKLLKQNLQSGFEAVVTTSDTLEAFKKEINAKMQFLADKIAMPAAKVATICQALELNHRLSKMLAVINPTQFMRTVLNETRITAKATSEEYIMVWPCKKVDTIAWRHIPNKCFADIPVSYGLEGKEYKGFMDPNTENIFAKSTEVDCETAPKVVFKINQEAHVYAAGQVPVRIDHLSVMTLPLMQTNFTHQLFTMPDNWVFNSTDLHHHSLEEAIIGRLDRRVARMEEKDAPANGPERTKRDEAANILSFFSFEGTRVYHILEGLGVWLFRVLAMLGGYTFFERYFQNNSRRQGEVFESTSSQL